MGTNINIIGLESLLYACSRVGKPNGTDIVNAIIALIVSSLKAKTILRLIVPVAVLVYFYHPFLTPGVMQDG